MFSTPFPTSPSYGPATITRYFSVFISIRIESYCARRTPHPSLYTRPLRATSPPPSATKKQPIPAATPPATCQVKPSAGVSRRTSGLQQKSNALLIFACRFRCHHERPQLAAPQENRRGACAVIRLRRSTVDLLHVQVLPVNLRSGADAPPPVPPPASSGPYAGDVTPQVTCRHFCLSCFVFESFCVFCRNFRRRLR
jgi:hypothetical protein